MCPACLAMAATVVIGATSVGGLTAVVVRKFGGRSGEPAAGREAQSEGENHGTSENRLTR